jgi:hypothetical protein
VRYDDTKEDEFVNSRQWDEAESKFLIFEPRNSDSDSGFVINSFSGNERNRLFLSSNGNFADATTVSGADFREDGRGFVLFDFDQDGWIDMGVSSAQEPRFRIMRNMIGENENALGHSVSVRLVGGHTGTDSQEQWSSRDPIGAELIVKIGETQRAFRLSAGEGLSSQNSKWVHIGMGDSNKIDQIEIAWPSGKKTTHANIAAGERVTLFENPEQSTSK